MSVVWCVVDNVQVKVLIENATDETDFDDVKVALKLKWQERFIGIGAAGIVIKHPITLSAISSRAYLKAILVEANGLPFPVDAPPAGITYISPISHLNLCHDHLLCVESYVFMCPFYYSNYQSVLFCVESVTKFPSHNDVCVCLSTLLYLLLLDLL